MGVFSLVKQVCVDFEVVLKMDFNVLQGVVYISLGVFYYQVFGWLLGFGNDEIVVVMLKKGLVVDLIGIDVNYFYGDFLCDQKDWYGVQVVFEKVFVVFVCFGCDIVDVG